MHVKRWDDLFILCQEMVRIIYFFNPVVWYVMPRISWTREAVCDSAVVSQGTISPDCYSRYMISVLKKHAGKRRLSFHMAGFTLAAQGIAFRLVAIQKEVNMRSFSVTTYLAVAVTGLFLLPMSPVMSSAEIRAQETEAAITSRSQDADRNTIGVNPLIQYILSNIQCHNPEEVASILWGDRISADFQNQDFKQLAAATDFDVADDIGNGHKAYVFYLLGNRQGGFYRPSFHFIKKQGKLQLVYKSRYVSTYAVDQPVINGHYQVVERWRTDLFNGTYDDRVKSSWGSRRWFWSENRYLPAYTDYSVTDATDPALIGTKREWNMKTKSQYQAVAQK